MEVRKIFRAAIDRYGVQAQLDVCKEECAELIVELSHYLRGREHHAPEEVADVEIMCEQMRIIFGNKEIDKIKAEKIVRLKKKLEL